MTELMTIEELAGHLRVTEKTIYRLLKRGKIPAIKVTRQWRFDKASIDEWIQQHTVGEKVTILVIDDEQIIRSLFKETLEELGHTVTTVETSLEGLALIKQRDFDLVFLDLKMPGINGAELFKQIKTLKPRLSVVIITGYPDSDMMAQALAQGPFGIMKKPFGESDIITAVDSFFQLTKR